MPFDIKSIFSKNFINLSLNQGVNIIATLIYTPILFQILGEENFGLIQLAFSVVVILSIFSLISAGVIVFLINDRRTQDKTFKLGDELEKKITSSIESIYVKREEDFKKTSKENIENVIDPFKKRIKEFEEEVRKNTTQQHEFHTKTKVTIDNLIEQTNQITSDANKLTKALSGESKTQGDYGELKLQMLLENSGLEENIHYKLQKSFTVKSEGDVSREIPDAVIYLPQNRNIIIDSKFSFSAYNDYCNTDVKAEKEKHGKSLTKNIRDRINDLSSTKYNQIEELNTPDIIFMFLGIDDSLSVALKHDPELVSFADKKRIALVSPSILHISIKMVENLWRLDGQRASVVKVYEEAQKLVDKLHGFTNVMDSLGTSIAQSQKKYDAFSPGPNEWPALLRRCDAADSSYKE